MKSDSLAIRTAALLATCAPLPIAAQDRTGPGGDVTLSQYQQRGEARVMAADTDGDGRVSRAEFIAAQTGHGDPAARFARMDMNGDGMLDRAEIDTMLTRRFQRMDADGNGVLSPQERAHARRPPADRARSGGAADNTPGAAS